MSALLAALLGSTSALQPLINQALGAALESRAAAPGIGQDITEERRLLLAHVKELKLALGAAEEVTAKILDELSSEEAVIDGMLADVNTAMTKTQRLVAEARTRRLASEE